MLAAPGGAEDTRAFASAAAAWLAHTDGAPEEAGLLLDRALPLARSVGDDRALALALQGVAMQRADRNEHVAALGLLREALALCRRTGDEALTCRAVLWVCDLLCTDARFDEARPVGERGLALARRLGSSYLVGWFLVVLARIEMYTGHRAAARALIDERLAMPAGRDTWEWAFALMERGRLLRAEDRAAARRTVAEALESFRRLRTLHHAQDAVEIAAALVATGGDPEWAARVFGAAEVWRERSGNLVPTHQRSEYDRDVAAVRAVLEPTVFAAAWAAGRALPAGEAVTEALAALAADEQRT